MKRKTSELTDKALSYAVACAEGMSFPSLKLCKYPDDHQWVMHPDGTIRAATEVPSNAMSRQYDYTHWCPSIDWCQGGPIIERERIELRRVVHDFQGQKLDWMEASIQPVFQFQNYTSRMAPSFEARGQTHLLAAMRCYVTWKLGPEVDIPDELC